MLATELQRELLCAHCGEPVPADLLPAGDDPAFCCSGCEAVHALLAQHGLDAYYALPTHETGQPARASGKTYTELDAPSFHERAVRALPGGLCEVDLFLEGTHCGACVWLVEKLPCVVPAVREARLDLPRSLARVRWDPRLAPLSAVARGLEGLGYLPHPFRGAELERRRRAEERAFLVRLAVAGALAGNVMLIAFALYGGMLEGMEARFQTLFRGTSLTLSLAAVFGPGRVFLQGAWAAVRTRTPHIDLPVGVALLVGLLGGAWNTIQGTGEVYFDTVCLLIFLLLAGRWLQQRQRGRAADAAELLASLAPGSARRIGPDGTSREVPLELLEPGDRVEVRAGEGIPCDGTIRAGSSHVDASLLTGESRPVAVQPGEAVHAGTANLSARLEVEVERTGEESRVGRLMQRVAEASRRKAPVVQLADRIAGVFVSVVLLLAALTFALWSQLAPAQAIDHTVALLIVTCPCALGLATPLAISAALGRAARAGVLIKGGDVLQRLAARGGRVWLDKTGTLTEGRLRLVRWEGDPALRAVVLGLETASAHPIAAALREAWPQLRPASLEAPAEAVGGGLSGRFAGRQLLFGSPACLRRAGVAIPSDAEEALAGLLSEALTPVLLAVDGRVRAWAGFGDPLRPEARATVERLRARGFRVGILSGDHPQVVAARGRELGLAPEDLHGGLLPEDKEAHLRARVGRGELQLMVGDGVNDAAALSLADAGIGVHGGSEAALEAAEVYLSRGGLTTLAELLDLAAATFRTIRLNLAISLAYNLLAAGLAVAGLINPLVAAVLMPLSSLGVIANSYRAPEAAWR